MARAQANELLQAIAVAEDVIVTTIERECEALRTGRMLAAEALQLRLADASRLYLNTSRAARASLWTIEQVLPGTQELLEERRAAFAALLKVELAVLAAERAAADAMRQFRGIDPAQRALADGADRPLSDRTRRAETPRDWRLAEGGTRPVRRNAARRRTRQREAS